MRGRAGHLCLTFRQRCGAQGARPFVTDDTRAELLDFSRHLAAHFQHFAAEREYGIVLRGGCRGQGRAGYD
ncbi:hypothetical protein AA0614_2099 [Komagataeibacter saccharivorans NRIC 0614]|nr:hypothetical protein AA0614_2099 [Komagataeibacter saccharivorans NRIC 0614]